LYNLAPILETLAYVPDVREHLKKFCYNNEVNYKAANSLVLTLANQNRQQVLDPASNNVNFSSSGSIFFSKNNSNYFDSSKQNSYGRRLIDGFEKQNYVNNIMPVNKKIGFEQKNNHNNSSMPNKPNIELEESSFNRKSVLPANKFPENSENFNSNATKNMNINKSVNRSFHKYKYYKS
jgi:hypothetical protein